MAIRNYVLDGVGPSSTIPYVVLDGLDIGSPPPPSGAVQRRTIVASGTRTGSRQSE